MEIMETYRMYICYFIYTTQDGVYECSTGIYVFYVNALLRENCEGVQQ